MLLDSSISNDAKVLAGILIHYNGPAGCYPKVETLMRDLNTSKRTTLRLLEELERYGFLSRDRHGRNNRYNLRPVYERPLRPDSFEATGQLATENAKRPRPERRANLSKPRLTPQPPLPNSPEKVPLVTPIDIEKRARAKHARLAEQAPSVTPVLQVDSTKIPEQVPPVTPIERHAAMEKVTSMIPKSVSGVAPISADRCQPRHLDRNKNQTLIKNHQHQNEPAAAGSDGGDGEQKENLRNGIAALQRAGVNVDTRDIGTHLGRNRKLDDEELLAWAIWVATMAAPGISNKPAFAAAKIRMGCRLEDLFPAIAAQSRRREETQASAVAAAVAERTERERAAQADELLATLPKGERAKLRAQALDDGGVWLARGSSRSLLERIILATERRLVLREIRPATVTRDHSAYPELPPL
jgi:hypothetical protein